MTIKDSTALKGYFNTGDIPSENNFADLIDSSQASIILQSSTVAGATSLNVSSVPNWITVNGGFVVVDIGTLGCEIRYVSASAISGTVITVSGSLVNSHNTNAAIFWSSTPTVNVDWFGAKGNGVTDDTNAINNALNAGILLPNTYTQTRYGRMRVLFSAGRIYKTTDALDLCEKQGIEVDGGSPTFGAIIHCYATGKAAIEIIGSQNIVLKNLEIYGDSTNIPAVAIMVSRSNTVHGINGVQISFEQMFFGGSFSKATYYAVETESNFFNNCWFGANASGSAMCYISANNDLNITPVHDTLSNTGYGEYMIKFQNSAFTTTGDTRAFYLRTSLNGLVARDCYIFGSSLIYPTVEIEGYSDTVMENILFEGTPATRLKFTYKAGDPNTFEGVFRDIIWGSATTYLIYADDNTSIKQMKFEGHHTMAAYLGVYAPLSIYNTQYSDFRGLTIYAGSVFAYTIRNISEACKYWLGDSDTISINQDAGNIVEDFSDPFRPTLQVSWGGVSLDYGGYVRGGYHWDYGGLRLGPYYLWVDGSDRLRIKSSAPTSDTDGTIVGTQS